MAERGVVMNPSEAIEVQRVHQVVRESAERGYTLLEALNRVWDVMGLELSSPAFATKEARRCVQRAYDDVIDAAKQEKWAVRYTTAGVHADGFGTENLGVFMVQGTRVWRRVRIDPMHLDWQADNYRLFDGVCVDELQLSCAVVRRA